MAKVTITLTVDQAVEVRKVLDESIKLGNDVLQSKQLETEYKSRGSEGREQWQQLYTQNALRRQAREAMQ